MKEAFDLCKIFVLDSMHDQKITWVELSMGTLTFHFEELHFDVPHSPEAISYYNSHKNYCACTLIFSKLEEADLFAETRNRTPSGVEIVEYYDDEWIHFLQTNHLCIEVSDFYCGYKSVIMCGSLVTQTGEYHEKCTMRISADTAIYQWQSAHSTS